MGAVWGGGGGEGWYCSSCAAAWYENCALKGAVCGFPLPHSLLTAESTPVAAGLRRTRRRLGGGAGALAPSRCPTTSQGVRGLEAGGGPKLKVQIDHL